MASKPKINPPTLRTADPRYLHECEFALEPSIAKVVEVAKATGWSADHVALSIARIAVRTTASTQN